jgi:hypothetical protein
MRINATLPVDPAAQWELQQLAAELCPDSTRLRATLAVPESDNPYLRDERDAILDELIASLEVPA